MSTPMMKFAAGVALSWVRLYTAGLSRTAREGRRAEIESDLWEHGAGNGADGVGAETTALQVLGRLLLGVPADLSWRLEQRGAQRDTAKPAKGIRERSGAMVQVVKAQWGLGLAILFGGFTIFFGASIFIRFVGDGFLGAILFGLGAIVAAVLMLAGFFISERAPWKGAALLTIGAVTITALHFWMFFIYVPVALVIITFGIFRARRFARELDRIAPA